MSAQKLRHLYNGIFLLKKFEKASGISCPEIIQWPETKIWYFGVCAYYRPTKIVVNVKKCANTGSVGRQSSYAGYVVDRTPYGVLAHEMGHHVDRTLSDIKGPYFGNFSKDLRARTREKKITNYCPDDAEWFAEIFRLFLTNPDLLYNLRPKTYAELHDRFPLWPRTPWQEILEDAPERTKLQAEKKIRNKK